MDQFWKASSFNQPLNKWNVSNVTNMQFMFDGARSFNQPLNNWNVSNRNLRVRREVHSQLQWVVLCRS